MLQAKQVFSIGYGYRTAGSDLELWNPSEAEPQPPMGGPYDYLFKPTFTSI